MGSHSSGFRAVDVDNARRMSAAEAIRYHYDNDTRFFSIWLDETLSYSSGRWHVPFREAPVASDLASAQKAKIEFHLDALQLAPGARLLDVGCGWGAVLKAAAAERGVAKAVGLTLSQEQYDHVRAFGERRIEVVLEDFFAYETAESFDAVVSIGAFEHFARPVMTRDQKVGIYRMFFDYCHRLMKPGAFLSLQTIVWDAVSFEDSKKWIPQTVFPQSDIPFIEEIASGSAGTFRLEYLENRREDYILTLDAWLANLRDAKQTIERDWGAEKYGFFEHYLRNSRLAFARRKNSLSRMVFRRR